MDTDVVDAKLRAGLGEPASTVLAEWALVIHRRYALVRWLVNGRSKAPVAIVIERDTVAQRSQKLIMKLSADKGGRFAAMEVARHALAVRDSPEFASKHLAELVNSPLRVGDGTWLTFQRIAGDAEVEVMTVLLHQMLGRTSPNPGQLPKPVDCDAPTFARLCGNVVGGVLAEWAGEPHLADSPVSVSDFLKMHVGDQLAPGDRLHSWSQEYPDDTIVFPAENGGERPNPFALVRGAYYGDRPLLQVVVGKTHGDLHTDNTLIKAWPTLDVDQFFLIDNDLYEEQGPMSRDPAHFLLYIVARTTEAISADQRSALADVLIDPTSSRASILPGWLVEILNAVQGRTRDWIGPSGFSQEWREQALLSLLGCSLLFLGRSSTRAEDKPWFLLLAARAAEEFMTLHPGDPQVSGQQALEHSEDGCSGEPAAAAPSKEAAVDAPAASGSIQQVGGGVQFANTGFIGRNVSISNP